ncbi:Lactoylglutathione lyase (Glo1) [Lasiodiplodia theobromae]|uniref:Lactoylglutathione lyase (Glo1) n=1 Tax=Lasiodiplodia theobromae TaxID=45133 RepID=UPI0015C3D00F|nr:Lactoylglutathione lyase (Glo1) [Lasiodiplodia theobromae]KAF4536935.1 Lactoylglutathione lyase (Glo1) [Lasiodiplodia theobromae]
MSSSTFSIDTYSHTGIVVRSLDKSLHFWHNCLGLPIQRRGTLTGPNVGIIAGAPAGSTIHVAHILLPIPGAAADALVPTLELLEYEIPAEAEGKKEHTRVPEAWSIGAVHVAVVVKGLDGVVEKVREEGWAVVSGVGKTGEDVDERVRGWRICYLRGPDGEIVELMEPPGESE